MDVLGHRLLLYETSSLNKDGSLLLETSENRILRNTLSYLQEKTNDDVPMPTYFRFLALLAFKIFTAEQVRFAGSYCFQTSFWPHVCTAIDSKKLGSSRLIFVKMTFRFSGFYDRREPNISVVFNASFFWNRLMLQSWRLA